MVYDKELVKLLIQDHFKKPINELIEGKKFIPFISYSTRIMREGETNGVEHLFITEEEADEILKDKDRILAYTEINNRRYFTLTDQMKDHNVYIIDPNGIKDIQERHPDTKLNIYYIGCSFNNRYRRYMQRLGLECTAKDMWKFKQRDDSEGEQFTKFESSNIPHKSFINDNPYLNGTVSNIFCKIIEDYDPNAIICIVGRTASGKDTILRHLLELFNDKEE
jgi:guanylate kinase